MGYTNLKSILDANIKTNGSQSITGAKLNQVMTQVLQGVDIADRVNGTDTTGMTYKILDKSKTFAEQVTGQNTIYEIRDDFTISANFTMPNNCVLKFNGGSISGNYTLSLNGCEIIGCKDCIGSTLVLSGSPVNTYKLEWFEASNDAGRLDAAINRNGIKGVIVGGNITISSMVSCPGSMSRDITIKDATIILETDMFTTERSYDYLPNFVNCKFIGNGHSIFSADYVVAGQFDGCQFVDCSIMNKTNESGTTTLQSAYIRGCSIQNSSVPFIKCDRLYDTHMVGCTAEAQAQTIVDTSASVNSTGGTQQLWVDNCIFEGFSVPVFNLSGGNIRVRDSYFESNTAGSILVTKENSAIDLLTLEVTGCKFNSSVNAIVTSGFTDNYRVVISINNNNFAGSGKLYSGLVQKQYSSFYGNRKSTTSEILVDGGVLRYNLAEFKTPSVNTTYFTRMQGGFYQFGKLVLLDFRIKAVTAISSSLVGAITGLPKPLNYTKIFLLDTQGVELETLINIPGNSTSGNLVGATTANTEYVVRGWYISEDTETI